MQNKTSISERNEVKLAVMSEKITNIQSDVQDIKDSLRDLKTAVEEKFVTKGEFSPVKSVVYGLVALILTAVVTAVIYLVVQ